MKLAVVGVVVLVAVFAVFRRGDKWDIDAHDFAPDDIRSPT